MSPGYRRAARRCEACLGELGPDATLTPFAGLQVCATCVEDYRPAVKAWGLTFEADTTEHRGSRHVTTTTRARAVRPTPLEIYAHLRAEGLGDKWRRLFGGDADPLTGNPRFDRQVWIEEHGVGVTMELLGDGGVQAAVVAALGVADSVELGRQEVLLAGQTTGLGFKPELLFALDLAAVAVAVQVERWARDRARGES
jgi:hypothetical protein